MEASPPPATLDDVAGLLRQLVSLAECAATPPPVAIDREGVAKLLTVCPSSLDQLRGTGRFGPTELRFGGSLRWRREEVLDWLANPVGGRLMTRKEWAAFQEAKRKRSR